MDAKDQAYLDRLEKENPDLVHLSRHLFTPEEARREVPEPDKADETLPRHLETIAYLQQRARDWAMAGVGLVLTFGALYLSWSALCWLVNSGLHRGSP